MSEVWSLSGYDVLSRVDAAARDVWRARDARTGEVVDLERLPAAAAADLDVLRRQAAWVPALDTPHLRRLRAVVEAGAGAVLVLDPAPGGSLAALLARRRVLQPGEVVTVAAPLASALAAVHGLGLAHGCVSAASVLLTAEGMPVLDLARPGCGQPAAALELADDVRGLAALCHVMLTGAPPFPPAALPLLAPAAPRALVAAVEQGLRDDRTQRPDAATFAALLRRSCVPTPVRLVAAEPVAPPVPTRSAPRGRHASRRRGLVARPGCRPSSGVVAAVAIALLVVAGGVAGWWSGQETTAAPRALHGRPTADAAPVRPPWARPVPDRTPPAGAAPQATPAAEAPVPAALDWRAIVDRLDAARADALRRADASALVAVWAAESPGMAADRHLVQQLAGAGHRAHGVRHVLRSVEVLDASVDRARLLVVDALAAAEVRDASGALVRRAPARSDALHELELVRTTGGWRLVEVGQVTVDRERPLLLAVRSRGESATSGETDPTHWQSESERP